jgi:hypothetical protein
LSPSADVGRTTNVESIGSGSSSSSSFMTISAEERPSPSRIAPTSVTTPTRAPPIRTSLPATRLAALGRFALSS